MQETDHLGVVFHLFEDALLNELEQQQADVIEQVSAGAHGSGGAAASKLGKLSVSTRANAADAASAAASEGSTRTQLEQAKRYRYLYQHTHGLVLQVFKAHVCICRHTA